MVSPLVERKYVRTIDGARGIAAIYILFHHVVLIANRRDFFSENILLHTIWKISSSFTIHTLMLFFLLSGFAIHYANAGKIRTLNWGQIKVYLYKRFRRIYPIYALAILLSLGAIIALSDFIGVQGVWPFPTRGELIGAFFLFSDLSSRDGTWISTLSTNGPLWSLSYEALYYLLYPAFSVVSTRYGMKVSLLSAAAVSVAAVGFAVTFGPTQISNMLSLYLLWCLGAYLAELKLKGERFEFSPSIVFCVLIGCIQSLWIFESFLMWRIPLSYDLYAGVCIFLVMFFSQTNMKSQCWSVAEKMFCFLFLLASSLFIVGFARFFQTTNDFGFLVFRVVLVCMVASAWLLSAPGRIFNWARQLLGWFEPSGAYSYGLYILQFPVLIVCCVFAEVMFGHLWLGVLLGVFLAVIFSMQVELRMQPVLVKGLDRIVYRGGVGRQISPAS